MRIEFDPEAHNELMDAARYYESKAVGLGGDFLDAVDEALRSVQADPTRLAEVRPGIRMYSLKRFPYGIYYGTRQDVIQVLVIAHHHRDPDYWRKRISGSE